MQIGFTEQGDGGINLSWFDKLDTVDGAIIITKRLTDNCIDKLLAATKPVILHCGCTGWGGTWLEPQVPGYIWQLKQLTNLINKGFDPNRIVLRIDPIIPTSQGITHACDVLNYVISNDIPIQRIRISILDEYKHVKDRIIASGHEPFYGPSAFYAPKEMMQDVIDTLQKYPFTYETCAEDFVSKSDHFTATGCISSKDLNIMNIPLPDKTHENGQNRSGCHCLTCKKELLSCKAQCPNACVYCYWKPTTYNSHKI